MYEGDWLLPALCLYPFVGVCGVPLMERSFKQTNKQTVSGLNDSILLHTSDMEDQTY